VYRLEALGSCIAMLNVLINKYGINEQYIILHTSYLVKSSMSSKSILLEALCCTFNKQGGIGVSIKQCCAGLILVGLESSQA